MAGFGALQSSSGTGECIRTSRAFGALSFEEEKHAVLSKSHAILAANCRAASISSPVDPFSRAHAAGAATTGKTEAGAAAAGPTSTTTETTTPAAAPKASTTEASNSDLAELLAANQNYVESQAWSTLRQLQMELDQALNPASGLLLSDKEVMLLAVTAHASNFARCSFALRGDPEMALAAVAQWPGALEYATPQLRANREAMLEAVKLHGEALAVVSQQLRGDKELVLEAVRQDPAALAHANIELLADRDVVLAALRRQTPEQVESTGESMLGYASEGLQGDEEVVLEAVRSSGEAIEYASDELRADKDFLLKAMRIAPLAHRVYEEADESLQGSIPWEEFAGVAHSDLAIPGDAAPVVTVRATKPTHSADADGGKNGKSSSSSNNDSSNSNGNASSNTDSTSGPICLDVTLLSGATIQCSLLEISGFSDPRVGPEDRQHSAKIADEDDQPGAAKRAKLYISDPDPVSVGGTAVLKSSWSPSQVTSAATVTVGQLAKAIKAELVKQNQVSPAPPRIFVIFEKEGCAGEGACAVTPWDWKRPVLDFL